MTTFGHLKVGDMFESSEGLICRRHNSSDATVYESYDLHTPIYTTTFRLTEAVKILDPAPDLPIDWYLIHKTGALRPVGRFHTRSAAEQQVHTMTQTSAAVGVLVNENAIKRLLAEVAEIQRTKHAK